MHDVFLHRVAHVEQDADLQGKVFRAGKLPDPLYGRLVVDDAEVVGREAGHQSSMLVGNTELEMYLEDRAPEGVRGEDGIG
ncbi:MAG TPA: hypothetical protein VII23_11240 [Terriglobales bacterium]